MKDRARILESLRKNGAGNGKRVDELEPIQTVSYDDAYQKAKEMIQLVGGTFLEMTSDKLKDFKPEEEGALLIMGEFVVAENGAIWTQPPDDEKRADVFLAEHLYVGVAKEDVVHTMHQAYARLKNRKFAYGTFISGPSKTADIEQSLVIGAQGPKSCTVIFY